MKVIHAPYNIQEQFDTAYDHNNAIVEPATSDASRKVFRYYTQLNSKRIQDLTLDCDTTFTDYLSNRRMLLGSVLANINTFQYNWHHCDDFTHVPATYSQDSGSEFIAGIPMQSSLTWAFVGEKTRMMALNHYSWFVFSKKMTILPGQVIVD